MNSIQYFVPSGMFYYNIYECRVKTIHFAFGADLRDSKPQIIAKTFKYFTKPIRAEITLHKI